jgi:hypothetical protein
MSPREIHSQNLELDKIQEFPSPQNSLSPRTEKRILVDN